MKGDVVVAFVFVYKQLGMQDFMALLVSDSRSTFLEEI